MKLQKLIHKCCCFIMKQPTVSSSSNKRKAFMISSLESRSPILVVIICKNSSKSIVPLPSLSISAIIFLISYYQSNSWFWSQENLLGNIIYSMTKLNKILFYKSMQVFWKDQKGHDRKKEIRYKVPHLRPTNSLPSIVWIYIQRPCTFYPKTRTLINNLWIGFWSKVKDQLTSFFGSKPRALPHMPMFNLIGTHDLEY